MKYTDIAIVGGGLAGSTAAAMLGRAGVSVILIDRSASMNATDMPGGKTRLDEAKRRAPDLISGMDRRSRSGHQDQGYLCRRLQWPWQRLREPARGRPHHSGSQPADPRQPVQCLCLFAGDVPEREPGAGGRA